jgi:hypothetical protein
MAWSAIFRFPRTLVGNHDALGGEAALLCGHPEGASRGMGGGRPYDLDRVW